MDDNGLRTEHNEGTQTSREALRGVIHNALRSLRVRTRAELVWFHRAARVGGRTRYVGIETVGISAGGGLKALEGEPIERDPVDLERPGRSHTGTLVRTAVDPVLGPAHHRQVYGPAGLNHELSMLIYENGRFIGRVVAVGGRRGFMSSAPRYWNGVRAEMARVIREVEYQRRQQLPVSSGTFIVDQGRRVEFATEGAWPWLSEPEFRERFAQLGVPSDSRPRLAGDAEVRVIPMTSPGRRGLMVEISPAAPVMLAADGVLTPTQRRVAEYACHGATTQEIASTMRMSVETVRTHIREVYRRLEVGSRVELASKIRPTAEAA